ncbi:NADH-quinone oxidoreductase subunit M [Rhodobacter sphaeroides]|nr:NADH-quinone oxidoreductase subunit M [Cereibacter sphaeroides]
MGYDMELTALILLPFFGGVAALFAGRWGRDAERWVAILALSLALLILISSFFSPGDGRWIAIERYDWAPSLGVQVILAMDGLSGALLLVSLALGIVSVVVSWKITEYPGLLNAALLWTVAASNGVFLSFDLLVFAFFWELMLVPAFLLISVWGHGDREAAALKFLVFNAVAGLGLLAAVFYLGATGDRVTFDAFEVAERQIPHGVQVLLLLGFAGAFLVKLPVPPLHAWLPDAHTQAPTAGSILLAGLLLKTGAYGLFRFPPMLFPEGFATLAPFGLALGAFGSIYGALLACGQTDAKRLVAYTSVAHMSIVLMGICGGVYFSLMGAGVEMVAHAFSASALFLLIGALYDRTGTRDLRELGGLQQNAPRFAAAFAVFFSAALAMPGTANFLGEALVITGMFQVNWIFASITLISLVVSVVYATRLFKRVVFGTSRRTAALEDLTLREMGPIVLLAVATLLFGMLPQMLMGALEGAVEAALISVTVP